MVKESLFTVFYYENESENLIEELCQYFDNHCPSILEYFEIIQMPFKVKINIIPTKNEYDVLFKEEFGFEANKSSRGFCTKDASINYLSINDYKNTTHKFEKDEYFKVLEGFKKTLIHEFVHIVNKVFNKIHNCGFSAPYLFEGIAIYLSKQKENEDYDFDFTIEELLTKDSSKRKYYACYLIVKYLIENYSKEKVFELLKDKEYAQQFLKEELYDKAKKFYN